MSKPRCTVWRSENSFAADGYGTYTQHKLHFVVGRAIVVHKNADDFKSQPSGAAEPRVAVGVIGFANIKDPSQDTASETFADEFWVWLQTQNYREEWSRWPADQTDFIKGESPHGAWLNVYVNQIAAQNPADPPLKSIIIKEN